MKLARKTRRRYHEAAGEPIVHTWPKSAPEALRGHEYPVYNRDGQRAFKIRVERVWRRESGTKVEARIVNDPHRPLFGIEGTRNELGDYESEPERVSAAVEAQFAQDGRQKALVLSAEKRHEARESQREHKERKLAAKGHTKGLERLRRSK